MLHISHFMCIKFFEDDNFGHDNTAYDESRDEHLGDVVTDINENLELQAIGNREVHANINGDLEEHVVENPYYEGEVETSTETSEY